MLQHVKQIKIGRNDPCWCKSGRKYKQCHMAFDEKIERIRQEGHVVPTRKLIKMRIRSPLSKRVPRSI